MSSNAAQSLVRLLLVDNHPILRQGLKQLLAIDKRIQVVGEAENGEEAIVKALSIKPDVILMDINMPKVNGYEASQAILTAWPDARILVLTNQDDTPVVRKFMDLKIMGFLLKDVEVEKLIEAIHRVMSGERLSLSEELTQKMSAAKLVTREEGIATLTEREQEVLAALAKGNTNQQLADLLSVSPKTVHNHLYNIYGKIGVSSRAETIVWAMHNGFAGN